MAKKRKTREQKKLADLRHSFTHQMPTTFEVKLPSSKISSPTQAVATTSNLYSYLIKDLTKTFLLTSIIIALQVVLFFMLKTHTFVIPGLNY